MGAGGRSSPNSARTVTHPLTAPRGALSQGPEPSHTPPPSPCRASRPDVGKQQGSLDEARPPGPPSCHLQTPSCAFGPCLSSPRTHTEALERRWEDGLFHGSEEGTEARPGCGTRLTCDFRPGGGDAQTSIPDPRTRPAQTHQVTRGSPGRARLCPTGPPGWVTIGTA